MSKTNYKYARIASYHILGDAVSRGGQRKTVCGRWIPFGVDILDAMPLDEKSCESCTRLVIARGDPDSSNPAVKEEY